jgi:hypothetical protein
MSGSETAFEPKAVCLMSTWPFLDNYREMLKQMYRIAQSTNQVPLERII